MWIKFVVGTLSLSHLASEVVPGIEACVWLHAPAAVGSLTTIRGDIATFQAARSLVVISVDGHEFS